MLHLGRDDVPLAGIGLKCRSDSDPSADGLLSVAHEVKIKSLACAPINSATCSRAVSMTDFSFAPNLQALDGFPPSVVRYGIIASSTSGSMGVVALWSRKITMTSVIPARRKRKQRPPGRRFRQLVGSIRK
ncbi:MAG TPA: hypothetical protein VG028_06180 [Terriglobia bacterium]|nr:hypothetical protein [Terriglobia bacterium]